MSADGPELERTYESLSANYLSDPLGSLNIGFMLMETDRKDLPDTVWAKTPLFIGYILEKQGLSIEGLGFLLQALQRLEDIGRPDETGYLRIDIGNIYFAQKHFREAGEMYDEAIKIFSGTEKWNGVYTALNNFGLIALQENDPGQAVDWFKQARDIVQEKNLEPHVKAFSYRLLRDVYRQTGEMDSSQYYTEQVLNISGPRDIYYNKGQIEELKGEILLEEGDTVQALACFTAAEQEYSEPLNVFFLSGLYPRILDILIAEGDTENFPEYYKRSENNAEKGGFLNSRIENAAFLAEHYRRQGNFQKELEAVKILNSRLGEESAAEKEMQTHRLDIQTMLVDYRRRLDAQNLKLESERKVRNASILAVLLLFAMLVLLFMRYQNKKRTHRIILEQRQRLQDLAIEIEQAKAEELHRNLTWKSTQLHELNEFLEIIQEKMDQHMRKSSEIDKKDVRSIIREIRSNIKEEHRWEEFEAQFVKIHPGFFRRLGEICPTLSVQEKKICAYHRMNLDTKEIAELTSLSVRTVQNHRYRIRLKLKLPAETDFQAFISSL